MKRAAFIQHVIAFLAVAGLCFPQIALAAPTPTNPAPAVADVRLHDGGIVHGRVVSSENAAMADTAVSLRSGEQILAIGRTDRNGYFAFTGVSNGVFQMETPGGRQTVRLWTAGTAPPAAQPYARIVYTVRGQCCEPSVARTVRDLMANPFFVAGLIAAAVAIPVAIHNSKGPSSP